jgi:arylsulfatase A-like enzyme
VPDLTGSGSQREGVVYVEYTSEVTGKHAGLSRFHISHRGATRNHMQAIFHNGYKGVRYNTSSANTAFRVYDVATDPQETTNLAGQPGVPSQAELEARVAQVRRAGGAVTRPYDGVQMPCGTVAPQTRPALRRL